jgi:hypothetical protein
MEFDGTTLHNSLFIDRLFHNYLLDTLLLSRQIVDYNIVSKARLVNMEYCWCVV